MSYENLVWVYPVILGFGLGITIGVVYGRKIGKGKGDSK